MTWILVASSSSCAHGFGAPSQSWQARRHPAYKQVLKDRVEALIGAVDPTLHLGLYVIGQSDKDVLVARNADSRFVPASTLKVLTAAAALDALGPADRFVTELFVDDVDHIGRTINNIYLRGSGDPSLSVCDVQALVQTLKDFGINRVLGDIVIDDTAFDTSTWGSGWMWDDLKEGFAAPIGAVNVAGNVLEVQVLPAAMVGQAARVFLAPKTRFVTPAWMVTTQKRGAPTAITIATGDVKDVNQALGVAFVGPPAPNVKDLGPAMTPPPQTGLAPGNTLAAVGTIALDGGLKSRRLAVREPSMWAAHILREALLADAIQIKQAHNYRRGVVADAAVPIATHTSAELGVLLPQFVKASNNQAMESLLKRLGHLSSGQPGSFDNGAAAVKRFVTNIMGQDAGPLTLVDGSGLSRYSLVSPKQMANVISYAHDRFVIGAEFVASLPIGGLDGTLSQRMFDMRLNRRVRAKTGTMTGVSSLVGQIYTEDNETLVFALMIDNATVATAVLRRLQDAILLALAQRPPAP